MSDDRDRRRPHGPPPGVSLREFPNEETTGQHVRVALIALDEKLDEAIKIDKNDHRQMTDTMSQHGRDLRHVTSELGKLGERMGKVEGAVQGAVGKLGGVELALNTLNSTVQSQQQLVHVGISAKTELDVHGAKLAADDRADTQKRRREIGYGVVKVLAIAMATWIVAHYTGLH